MLPAMRTAHVTRWGWGSRQGFISETSLDTIVNTPQILSYTLQEKELARETHEKRERIRENIGAVLGSCC
jgi:hypothetical protein